MKCIYCLKDLSKAHYSKAEHVLPKSFGSFEDNFTLIDTVCDSCNQYFGNELEIHLARDTFEGTNRVEHKIQDNHEFKSAGKKSRLKIRLDEGPFKGALAYRDYYPVSGEVALFPQPQVGFLKTGTHHYFHIDKLPEKSYLTENNFELDETEGIIILGCDIQKAISKLEEKGIAFKDFKIIDDSLKPTDTIGCIVEGSIDQAILRAIAKIAFNYAAYWHGSEFMCQNDFDTTRKYIRYGNKEDHPIVIMHEKPILGDEPVEGKRRAGHLITMNIADDKVSLLSKISLMNWMTYLVSLAKDYSGTMPFIPKGHLFDYHNRKIHELTTTPPNYHNA